MSFANYHELSRVYSSPVNMEQVYRAAEAQMEQYPADGRVEEPGTLRGYDSWSGSRSRYPLQSTKVSSRRPYLAMDTSLINDPFVVYSIYREHGEMDGDTLCATLNTLLALHPCKDTPSILYELTADFGTSEADATSAFDVLLECGVPIPDDLNDRLIAESTIPDRMPNVKVILAHGRARGLFH